MQVHFQTARYAPPRRISLRIGAGQPCDQYEGFYRDSWWTFEVGAIAPTDFRLVLDGMTESVTFSGADMRRGQLREDEAQFSEPPLSTECGRLQRAWFPVGGDRPTWDAIVVGSGMGGGTLMYALATRHPELVTLGLEAGPLLFPTHAGNLARRSYAPSVDVVTDLWGLYNDLGVQAFDAPKDAQGNPLWAGKEVFALGGRSLFWGALAPKLSTGDKAQWPTAVINDLESYYYRRAEELLNVGSPTKTHTEDRAIEALRSLPALAGCTITPAPVAVQRVPKTSWELPDGIFSAADLLLDARLRVPQYGDPQQENWPPYLHLSELVTKLTYEQDRKLWAVHGVNVLDGTPTSHVAKRVVLAAGAIETARLALASGVGGPSVGVGITEHDMWWVHFQVPARTPFNTGDRSAKILCVPDDPTVHDWNLQVEINVELNESRHVPVELAGSIMQVDPGACGAQLVFLRSTALNENQRITAKAAGWPGFNLTAEYCSMAVSLDVEPDRGDPPQDIQDAATAVIAALHGRELPNRDLKLRRGERGYVGHEVGTMRMPPRNPGPGAPGPVVDESLQVIGSPGLYVCDNSVFPISPAANPSLTLCALSLRLADHLAATAP